jgi:hypothetical protein
MMNGSCFEPFQTADLPRLCGPGLEHEEIPCMVEARALESARESQFCLFVAKKLAHRARWIVAQLPATDAELDFLATGKLPGQEEN